MQEWHLENSQFEVLEKQNGDCLIKDKRNNRFYFKNELFASKKYEFDSKSLICWSWKDSTFLLGVFISIISIVIVFYNYDFIYGSNIVYGNDEYFKTIVFIGINIILHEMSHYL